MLQAERLTEALALLPLLHPPDGELARAFAAQAALVHLPVGSTIFEEGDVCSSFAILLSGVVRVFTIGETGREITLYRFDRGESCMLTTSCILSSRQFPAIAVVEQDARAYVLPHTVFQAWIDRYEPWRNYVFQLLAQRLASVMALIDEVAFRRMDARIAEWLLRRLPADQPVLQLTHQQIAAELGTSREVVSRILADFAADGLLQVTRGMVTIIDTAGLRQRAERS